MNYSDIVTNWVIPLGVPTILGTLAGVGVRGWLDIRKQRGVMLMQFKSDAMKETRIAKRHAIASLHQGVWDIHIAILEAGMAFREYLKAGSDPVAVVAFNASGRWPQNVVSLKEAVAKSQKDVASKLMYLDIQIAVIGDSPLSQKAQEIRQLALQYMNLHPDKTEEIKSVMDTITREVETFSRLVTDALQSLVSESTELKTF